MNRNQKRGLVGLGLLALFVLPNTAKANTTTNNNNNGSNSSNSNNSIPNGVVLPGAPEGDINESFWGTKDYPGTRVRNNNPGNIKINSGNAWQGKVPESENTDGTFEQFKTFPLGARAMIKLLKNYIAQGRNTPKKIIQYWDLGAAHYTAYLVTETGYSENQVLQADEPTLKKLSQAIAKFENGTDILTDARFNTAYALV